MRISTIHIALTAADAPVVCSHATTVTLSLSGDGFVLELTRAHRTVIAELAQALERLPLLPEERVQYFDSDDTAANAAATLEYWQAHQEETLAFHIWEHATHFACGPLPFVLRGHGQISPEDVARYAKDDRRLPG